MGISISSRCGNLSGIIGYGGFYRLRRKVAEIYGGAWWKHYERLDNAPFFNFDGEGEQFFEEFDKETERLLKEKKVSEAIVEFCLQPDEQGEINCDACKEIYKCVKDYDDNLAYGYVAHDDCFRFRDFKLLLKECIDLKCDLIWE